MGALVDFLYRFDLSYPRTLIGAHFMDIVGVLSIILGGAFLLFSWKHHRYFIVVTGFLAGAFAGLLFKDNVMPDGRIVHTVYIVVCGTAIAAICHLFKRFVGMILGGFAVALVLVIGFPHLLSSGIIGGKTNLLTLALAFMLGGGLGAIYPKFFFIVTSALFGSAFATFGITTALWPVLMQPTPRVDESLLHAVIMIPLFLFGTLYQLWTTRGEPFVDDAPAARARSKSDAKPSAKPA